MDYGLFVQNKHHEMTTQLAWGRQSKADSTQSVMGKKVN